MGRGSKCFGTPSSPLQWLYTMMINAANPRIVGYALGSTQSTPRNLSKSKCADIVGWSSIFSGLACQSSPPANLHLQAIVQMKGRWGDRMLWIWRCGNVMKRMDMLSCQKTGSHNIHKERLRTKTKKATWLLVMFVTSTTFGVTERCWRPYASTTCHRTGKLQQYMCCV